MSSEKLTVTEEHLVLFREHLEIQKQDQAEQSRKNRADEEIEKKRISAEIEVLGKNLEHAGKVLSAQAADRAQIRSFWSTQIRRLCWLLGAILAIAAAICVFAISVGQTAIVFDAIKTIGTHVLAILGGIGADRVWIHRKKTGISSPSEASE